MPKLLIINAALNCGSTGRIAEQIGILAENKGWDVLFAHSARYEGKSSLPTHRIQSKVGEYFHFLWNSMVLGKSGLGSSHATNLLIKKIDEFNPDVIHIHNLHGHYINFQILLNYIKQKQKPVVWTFHDCWPVTGHCTYFDGPDCHKWQTECNKCPLLKDYPKSLFFDTSRELFLLKKALYEGLDHLTIVPVSDWLGDIVKKSVLKDKKIKVIHNGIDLDRFKSYFSSLKQKLEIADNKIIVLGVSSDWDERKGLNDFIKISKDIDLQIILIGLTEEQIKALPENIIGIKRTQNQSELAQYYSLADVFANPTYSDNFPTTNIEALACGTPVITYRTGGSPEAIDINTGMVVEKGDIQAFMDGIRKIHSRGKDYYKKFCRQRAERYFNKDDRFQEYINLYNELLKK